MRQIVCFSTASGRQDPLIVAAILAVSRMHNFEREISGLLIAGGHRYLQVIEGTHRAVGSLIDRIRADPRHLGVTVLIDRTVLVRSFESWSMAYLDEPRIGEFATFADLAQQLSRQVLEPALRRQLRCFTDSFSTQPVHLPAHPWRASVG